MKKTRTQPAFATLTEAEIEQIAAWLRHQTYEVVLDRIRKPRAEGGFGLNISRSPLERLHAKVALLDLINPQVAADKKLTLAQFESICQGDTLPAPASDQNPPSELSEFRDPPYQTGRVAEIHNAILDTTLDLVRSSDHTPTQLLALQRLADFPARAHYRTHKIQMDLHRKSLAEQRLQLAERAVKVREEQLADRRARRATDSQSARRAPAASSARSAATDSLGPLIRKPEDILARALKKFGTPVLPSAPPANEDATPTPNPNLTPNPNPTPTPAPNLAPPPLSPFPPVQTQNPQSEIRDTCDLQLKVDSYTVQRAHEYWTWRELAATVPAGQKPPAFTAAHRHCPCGKPNPCPDHESEPYGEFPSFFWSISPHLEAYEICLTARNLPYRDPIECVPEQFRIYFRTTNH